MNTNTNASVMAKPPVSSSTPHFPHNHVLLTIAVLVVVVGGGYGVYQRFFAGQQGYSVSGPAAVPPKTFSFSRMKRDTIYYMRPGDILKIKDETPNTTRAISFTPSFAKTYAMEYVPDKKKWLYTLPQDVKQGAYLITVTTTHKGSGEVVKTKEIEIIIDKNSGAQKSVVDEE